MGIVFDPTLLLNVKSLYKEEYRLGLKVTELLRQKLKIDIDDGEASFIALHIINAELDSNMQQMYEITAVIEEILNLVREDFKLIRKTVSATASSRIAASSPSAMSTTNISAPNSTTTSAPIRCSSRRIRGKPRVSSGSRSGSRTGTVIPSAPMKSCTL